MANSFEFMRLNESNGLDVLLDFYMSNRTHKAGTSGSPHPVCHHVGGVLTAAVGIGESSH